MNRRAIIFHGTGAHPDVVWLPWLRERLTKRGYTVEAPHYPTLNVEPIGTFLPKVLANHTIDEHTVLIGHSGGAALLLAVLQHIDTTVSQAILVAGYATKPNTNDEPVLQDDYDWAAITAHVRDIYFINSRNDPAGCDDRPGPRDVRPNRRHPDHPRRGPLRRREPALSHLRADRPPHRVTAGGRPYDWSTLGGRRVGGFSMEVTVQVPGRDAKDG